MIVDFLQYIKEAISAGSIDPGVSTLSAIDLCTAGQHGAQIFKKTGVKFFFIFL